MKVMPEKEDTRWAHVPDQGEFRDACELVYQCLEAGLCPKHDVCEGCTYEWDHALEAVKAALGKPVKRQKCGACGALDSVWWSRDPDSEPVPVEDRKMWCHACGTVGPPIEWIDLPMEDTRERSIETVRGLLSATEGALDSVQIRSLAESIVDAVCYT